MFCCKQKKAHCLENNAPFSLLLKPTKVLQSSHRLKHNKLGEYFISNTTTTQFFVCSPYFPAETDGALTCEIPDVCPLGIQLGEQHTCVVTFNYLRERKTGPCIPLVIVQCLTHNISFTIYPPGYVPYGREPLVDIALDGFPIEAELEKNDIVNSFSGTLFDAALMASQGVFYPKEGPYDLPMICYDTQLNHIKKSALLLGIAETSQVSHNGHLAEALNIPRQFQIEQSSHIPGQPWNSIKSGQSIRQILENVPRDCLFERLVSCGFMCRIWPPLYIWNAEAGTLYKSAFCQRVNRHKMGFIDRAPPP